MKTATEIIQAYQNAIETFFLQINLDELDKIRQQLAECNKEDIPELKARERLMEDYLFRHR